MPKITIDVNFNPPEYRLEIDGKMELSQFHGVLDTVLVDTENGIVADELKVLAQDVAVN